MAQFTSDRQPRNRARRRWGDFAPVYAAMLQELQRDGAEYRLDCPDEQTAERVRYDIYKFFGVLRRDYDEIPPDQRIGPGQTMEATILYNLMMVANATTVTHNGNTVVASRRPFFPVVLRRFQGEIP